MTFPEARVVEVVEVPDAPLELGQVRVRTLYSGISAGTELTSFRGTSPHVTKRWDPETRLFAGGETGPAFPVTVLGYEEVGVVTEMAAPNTTIALGDVVWGTWGHRSSAVLDGEAAAARILPAGADPRIGIFSHIGAVALNSILDADIHVGETVAIFGLGVPGQLVAQLARLNGARVIAVDGVAARRKLATQLGADVVLDPAEPVAEQIRQLTDGRGADVAIEIAGNARALHEAIRSVAYSSRVVAAGFIQGDAAGLRLGEEFHHNRVQVVGSQISGSAPNVAHRWDRYRLTSTAIDLAASGRLQVLPLISHAVGLDEVADAYRMLDEGAPGVLQVVIDFEGAGR
ncbi:zinc-binding alcohol dehydrogenase [Cryobacterium sp. Y62]|uniref:zinc-dependent alcohol dehydrogenase n=1 Tax=Cryobacterium sp. Y62 TaxID=2048284 RepID=UPI001E29C735|nr:zinc-binding alcohol dehydrogenase [Cryobacterium sp. Y62]